MTKLLLIVAGNPFDGLRVYGPFADDDARYEFTEATLKDEYWWYPEVTDPASVEPESTWRQTACTYCGQDIEGDTAADGPRNWLDRAGSGSCRFYQDAEGKLVVPPEGQLHVPVLP